MQLPTLKRRKEIDNDPSTWSDIKFSQYTNSEKVYWFQERRIKAWLLKDTKDIKHKGESLLGLAAMVSIGVETLSQFRYGKTDDSAKYFPRFLEEYLSSDFKTEVTSPFPEDKEKKTTYSRIFYLGIRNKLMHSFLLRYAVLIEPLDKFLVWEKEKNRLLVDARRLLVRFEDGVNKYFDDLWKSKRNSEIYKNFFTVFKKNYS